MEEELPMAAALSRQEFEYLDGSNRLKQIWWLPDAVHMMIANCINCTVHLIC